jgi:hypothetical protein
MAVYTQLAYFRLVSGAPMLGDCLAALGLFRKLVRQHLQIGRVSISGAKFIKTKTGFLNILLNITAGSFGFANFLRHYVFWASRILKACLRSDGENRLEQAVLCRILKPVAWWHARLKSGSILTEVRRNLV